MSRTLHSLLSIVAVALFLPLQASGQVQAGPFEMMEQVFEGDYTEQEIKNVVYRIDEFYQIDKPAPDKYEAVGSVAVELAKDEPFTEMQLLVCTIEGHNDLVDKFHQMAGVCATQLSNQ